MKDSLRDAFALAREQHRHLLAGVLTEEPGGDDGGVADGERILDLGDLDLDALAEQAHDCLLVCPI